MWQMYKKNNMSDGIAFKRLIKIQMTTEHFVAYEYDVRLMLNP